MHYKKKHSHDNPCCSSLYDGHEADLRLVLSMLDYSKAVFLMLYYFPCFLIFQALFYTYDYIAFC